MPPPLEKSRNGPHDLLTISGFGRPFGLGRDAEGRLLIADMDVHSICRLTPDFDAYQWLEATLGWTPLMPMRTGALPQARRQPPGRFDGPHSVSAMPDGSLLVVTYYTPGIHVVPADGGEGTAFEEEGSPRLRGPATGHFDNQGRFLVTEYALNGIFVYEADGMFVGALGDGNSGFGPEHCFLPGAQRGAFDRPHMCRALPDGSLIVADTWNHRLQHFSSEGVWIGQIGGGLEGWRSTAEPSPAGRDPAAFNAPVAVSVGFDGSFLVTDWGNNRLQWFSSDGVVMKIDDTLGLDKPYDAQQFGGLCVVANSHKGSLIVWEG